MRYAHWLVFDSVPVLVKENGAWYLVLEGGGRGGICLSGALGTCVGGSPDLHISETEVSGDSGVTLFFVSDLQSVC